jgi:hypothetical protein
MAGHTYAIVTRKVEWKNRPTDATKWARMGMGKTGKICAALSDIIQQINEIDREKTASLNDDLPEMVKAEPDLEVEKVGR